MGCKAMENTTIYLSEIMTELKSLKKYKIHFAKSDGSEPLDVYMRDFNEWKHWNEWSNNGNQFNRDYIFSLISFYPERDTWLFGGIWEVIARDLANGGDHPYTIKLCDDYKKFIGRLKIRYEHRHRNVRNCMEKYFPKLELKEILEGPYSIQFFPGYKNFDVPFKTLENAMKQDNPAWRNALTIKGIYLITDTKTGKKYVGKASGEGGFWQRWSDYILDGHGGDVDLQALVKAKGGLEYAKEYYKFTLLEIVESNLEDNIDARESYWKRVLMSRIPEIGHNRN